MGFPAENFMNKKSEKILSEFRADYFPAEGREWEKFAERYRNRNCSTVIERIRKDYGENGKLPHTIKGDFYEFLK